MKKVLTIREIAEKIGADYSTIRTYLDGYRFAKFRDKLKDRKQVGYNCSNEFWTELINFVEMKRRYKYVDSIKEYLDTWRKRR